MYGGRTPAQRHRDQRDRIIRAAISEFAVQGFRHTTVDHIVATAGASRTTFYRFFDNREDCMSAALETTAEMILRAVSESITTTEPEDDLLEAVVRGYVQALVSDPDAARVLLIEAAGTSTEVDRIRSRVRSEMAETLRATWAGIDPKAIMSEEGRCMSIALTGLLAEPMVHLLETERMDEAVSFVPALANALHRASRPRTKTTRHHGEILDAALHHLARLGLVTTEFSEENHPEDQITSSGSKTR